MRGCTLGHRRKLSAAVRAGPSLGQLFLCEFCTTWSFGQMRCSHIPTKCASKRTFPDVSECFLRFVSVLAELALHQAVVCCVSRRGVCVTTTCFSFESSTPAGTTGPPATRAIVECDFMGSFRTLSALGAEETFLKDGRRLRRMVPLRYTSLGAACGALRVVMTLPPLRWFAEHTGSHCMMALRHVTERLVK